VAVSVTERDEYERRQLMTIATLLMRSCNDEQSQSPPVSRTTFQSTRNGIPIRPGVRAGYDLGLNTPRVTSGSQCDPAAGQLLTAVRLEI
jgi:hypothetical protein